MIRVFCFCTMIAFGIEVCDATTTTTARTPSKSMSSESESIVKKSEKIINSCEVGKTKLNSSDRPNCIYQNASNGLCFHFGKNNATYTEASRDCGDRGMRLASITKPHILDLLLKMIHKQNDSESENQFWVHIPNTTWTSIGNWSNTYSKYYNDSSCDGRYKPGIERTKCQFLMAKSNNTKLVLRLMNEEKDCQMKLKVFCQDKSLDNNSSTTSNRPTGNPEIPTLAIIVATSVGVLVLLIIVFFIIRSLHKANIHSHERMENASRSDTSQNEERKLSNQYASSKKHKCDTIENNKAGEYADYAELDDGSIDLANDVNNDNDDVNARTTTAHTSAQESGEEPSYFVLNKEPSVESLHTYEDCAFKVVSAASTLPMRYNSLVQNRTVNRCADYTDENVYDWPDLLQPTSNCTPKTRRTQSETEPQYFSLEIDETENIYDSVFPVDEPLKKPMKTSRTKHLSLQRKKQKNKHQGHVSKSQQTGGSRK